MTLQFREYRKADYQVALRVCVAAFTPIHKSFEATLGGRIFALQYHDWREQYASTFDQISASDPAKSVYVAELDGVVVGFVFISLDATRRTGEIGLNAVDPKMQGRGIGKAMYDFALRELKRRGAEIAYVGTGGECGARACAEGLSVCWLRQGHPEHAPVQGAVGRARLRGMRSDYATSRLMVIGGSTSGGSGLT